MALLVTHSAYHPGLPLYKSSSGTGAFLKGVLESALMSVLYSPIEAEFRGIHTETHQLCTTIVPRRSLEGGNG